MDVLTFRCEKNRYGPVADILTRFDATTQTFTPPPAGPKGSKARRGDR
jgi:hypothetical protein